MSGPCLVGARLRAVPARRHREAPACALQNGPARPGFLGGRRSVPGTVPAWRRRPRRRDPAPVLRMHAARRSDRGRPVRGRHRISARRLAPRRAEPRTVSASNVRCRAVRRSCRERSRGRSAVPERRSCALPYPVEDHERRGHAAQRPGDQRQYDHARLHPCDPIGLSPEPFDRVRQVPLGFGQLLLLFRE